MFLIDKREYILRIKKSFLCMKLKTKCFLQTEKNDWVDSESLTFNTFGKITISDNFMINCSMYTNKKYFLLYAKFLKQTPFYFSITYIVYICAYQGSIKPPYETTLLHV